MGSSVANLEVDKLYRAGNANRPTFSLLDNERLLITPGIVFDTVKEVDTFNKAVINSLINSGPLGDLNTHLFVLQCMTHLLAMLMPFGAYPTNEPIPHVVCRTVISDKWDGESGTPPWALPCLINLLEFEIQNFRAPTDPDQLCGDSPFAS